MELMAYALLQDKIGGLSRVLLILMLQGQVTINL